MAPIGTLWGHPIQRQSKVILAAAAVAGLELEVPHMEFQVTNKTPEYLGKFPLGKIPAFEDNKGLRIFEGTAIARYLSSLVSQSGLLGKDVGEAGLVDQWVHFGESEIATLSYEVKGLVAGYLGPYSKELHDIILQKQARSLKFLDEHLAARMSGYLISDTLTLADIMMASVSEQAAQITCGAVERAQYKHVFDHYKKVMSHQKVKEAFGEPQPFVEEGIKYEAKTA